MKKANIYWIIAAFCILRITGMQTAAPASSVEKQGTLKSFTFSMDNVVVSGRWMR